MDQERRRYQTAERQNRHQRLYPETRQEGTARRQSDAGTIARTNARLAQEEFRC